MLEIEARPFLSVFTELRAIQILINNIPDRAVTPGEADIKIIGAHVDRLLQEMNKVNARSAMKSAYRLKRKIEELGQTISYDEISKVLEDVESRFGDHLDDIRLFAISDHQSGLFASADVLLASENASVTFPSAIFEIEEAARCLALSRPTASAFHSIRMLEVGVRALGRHVGLEDPIPSDRSWGKMLKSIKDAIAQLYPPKRRREHAHSAQLERLYATLDAVKNPWRNATMHVETIYTENDAVHILNCGIVFMKQLMEICDESGHPKAVDTEEELGFNDLTEAHVSLSPAVGA